MKKISVMAAVLLALSVSAVSFAADMKVGFVDAQKVFEDSAPGKSVSSRIEEFVASRQKIIDLEEKEIETMGKDLKKQEALLSPEALLMKKDEIQSKFSEYQKKARSLNQEVADKKLEANKKFFVALAEAIKAISEKDGYDFVMDRNRDGGPLLYSKDTYDITAKVIAALDKDSN